MKYFFIAGEASGDLHASNLIKYLNNLDQKSEIVGWGGDKMAAQNTKILKHYNELAFMGFTEVLINLKSILQNFKLCKQQIKKFNPDIIILVDYPGFNLKMAKWIKKNNFKILYYISPQVWAWNKSRISKIKKYVDQLLVILPFEKKFYKQYNYNVEFIGHPLLEIIDDFKPSKFKLFKTYYRLNEKKIIALLPGSRKQEIKSGTKIFFKVVSKLKDYQFLLALPNQISKTWIPSEQPSNLKIIINDTYNVLSYAHAAIVTSGTATLETALFQVPQIVVYKGNYLSYQIAKRLITIKYISLVNLILNKKVVEELIQKDFNQKKIEKELNKILNNKKVREDIKHSYLHLRELLDKGSPSKKAAEFVVKIAKKNYASKHHYNR